MAITSCYGGTKGISGDGAREMTVEEFRQWLKRFDSDGDGRISKEELQEAIHLVGGWFAKRRTRAALQSADANHDGFLNDDEIDRLLIHLAFNYFKVRIVPY